MKKLTAIMMALVMVLGLTQCRPDKGNEGDTQNASKVKVSCVVPMNKGTRSEFDNLMTDGKIKWSAGTERIYLAIPDETNPQIVEMTAFTTVESNILAFEGEVAEGLLKNGEYDIWYFGNSKESGNSYIAEEIENEVIKSISGSIASQSGDLEDLGYCHIAKTTVSATTENGEVKLSLNGTLKNQIAIAHLDLEDITQLKGDAIIGTEYALQYNNGAFEFAVTPDAKANITITEGNSASYVILFPNATANIDLKSNTSKKVTFKGGVEANKIYYKHVSDMEFYPLTWEDYEEETNTINGHEYVDLGLPSGLLWATCNVGANSPEEYGDYFAWGETETKETYGKDNCLTYGLGWSQLRSQGYIYSDRNILASQHDAATAYWGGDWRMPTKAEQQELLDKCTWTWTMLNGVEGYKVTSKANSNYIFLPAAGYRSGSSLYKDGDYGRYRNSSLVGGDGNEDISYYLDLRYSIKNVSSSSGYRYHGYSVRPIYGGNFEGLPARYAFVETSEVTEITSSSAVCGGNVTTDNGSTVTSKGICWSTSPNPTVEDNKTEDGNGIGSYMSLMTNLEDNTTYYIRAYVINAAGISYGNQKKITTLSAVNANGHEYVDLGLPSGLLWATCNVGANSPEEYGNYYAWGETETKSEYTKDNSVTSGLSYSELQSKGYIDEQGNLTLSHDAARANCGDGWRMPTVDEWSDLQVYCTWTWTTQNGVKGYKIKSEVNSNYIFLPVAGTRIESSLYDESLGFYWSSAPCDHNGHDNGAFSVILDEDPATMGGVSNSMRHCGMSIRPVRE